MSLAGKALAAIGLHAASSAVHAQAYQCSVPQRIAVPRILPDGPPRTTSIAGYSLTLSWSPEYCRMRTHDPRDAMQCSGRNGRFGLVLHGLWPEGKGADWPQWCPTALAPSADALRPMLCTTPSPDLLAHFDDDTKLWTIYPDPKLEVANVTIRAVEAGARREAASGP